MNLTASIGYIAALCTTASFLPQALQIIKTKNTQGISLPMYTIFTIGTVLWLVFGSLSVNIPIMVANGITLLFAIIILFYKIKYK